jgi:carbamate kinase
MNLLIALGGNALLRRGQQLTEENQLDNIKLAAEQIVQLVASHQTASSHQLVLTHGNGPQIGLLALQSAALTSVKPSGFDLLGAQTDGMIGYLLEQELTNRLAPEKAVATLLTRVEVNADDPAFLNPTKFIGPVYTQAEAEKLADKNHWVVKADGAQFRRVVASPKPQKIFGVETILWLLQHHAIVIAAGGGGIPVVRTANANSYRGVNAIIDKDLCSALLAEKIAAKLFVIVTDVDAVFVDWGKPTQRAIRKISPRDLNKITFPDGSMAPKVEAACNFVAHTGNPAVIGSLENILKLIKGEAGTWVCNDCVEPVFVCSNITESIKQSP